MYLQYEQFINNYNLEKTVFYKFCQNATREEFLQSQIGFYYAVQAFPQMLCKLASKIETSEIRLKVAENIWEEHGNGKAPNFHTQSFMTYLKSLGIKDKKIEHNFFIDQWIEESLNLNLTNSEYAAYLAGIEYIYAKISLLICKTMENYYLYCPQEHYKKHGELDFRHAQELLEVAYDLNVNSHYEIFCLSVNKFIELFNQMTFITQKEVELISNEKVAFYYSREDSNIELHCIKNNNPSILTVCSGGEHIIHIKNKYPQAKIIALDINNFQLQIAQTKINKLLIHKENPRFNVGKFEILFQYFTKKINSEDIVKIQLNNYDAIKKLEILCRDIFSNKNLNIVFTDNATKYSSDDFSLHFFTVFLDKIREINNEPCNMSNILGLTLPNNLPDFINENNITYYHGDFESFFKVNKITFDLISLSNIGDWMPKEQYINIVHCSKLFLEKDGCVIARKLLGDYSLEDIFNNEFKVTHLKNDNTGFYKECVIGSL